MVPNTGTRLMHHLLEEVQPALPLWAEGLVWSGGEGRQEESGNAGNAAVTAVSTSPNSGNSHLFLVLASFTTLHTMY